MTPEQQARTQIAMDLQAGRLPEPTHQAADTWSTVGPLLQIAAEVALGFLPGSGEAQSTREAWQHWQSGRKAMARGQYGQASSDLLRYYGAVLGALPAVGAAARIPRVTARAVNDAQRVFAAREKTPLGLFSHGNLSQIPDAPQRYLSRYDPPRGVPQKTIQQVDNARLWLPQLVLLGAERGGLGWYNTDPLKKLFIAELGSADGERAFHTFINLIAANSIRNTVDQSIRSASFYHIPLMRGDPLPLIGSTVPSPYGHYAQRLHQSLVHRVADGRGIDPLLQPKLASFAENLLGNWSPITIDRHLLRSMDLRNSLGKLKRAPGRNEYGYIEKILQEEARRLGLAPAPFQASIWLGDAARTGLRSGQHTFLDAFEKVVARMAELTGRSMDVVARDFVRLRTPLLGLSGMLLMGYPMIAGKPQPLEEN